MTVEQQKNISYYQDVEVLFKAHPQVKEWAKLNELETLQNCTWLQLDNGREQHLLCAYVNSQHTNLTNTLHANYLEHLEKEDNPLRISLSVYRQSFLQNMHNQSFQVRIQKGQDQIQLNNETLLINNDGSLLLKNTKTHLDVHSLEQIDNVNKQMCDMKVNNTHNSVGFRTTGKMTTLYFCNNLEMKLVSAVIYRTCLLGLEERTRKTLYMNQLGGEAVIKTEEKEEAGQLEVQVLVVQLKQSLVDMTDKKQKLEQEQKIVTKLQPVDVKVTSKIISGADQWAYPIGQVVFNCPPEVCLLEVNQTKCIQLEIQEQEEVINQLICQTKKGQAKQLQKVIGQKYDQFYTTKGNNPADIDYSLLTHKLKLHVYTHEAVAVEVLIGEIGIEGQFDYQEAKGCQLPTDKIKIKKEHLATLPVDDQKCCWQVNKLSVYCVQSVHCVGVTQSLVKYMKVQCIVQQFKAKALDQQQAEDMFKAIHYEPKEGMLTPVENNGKGVKGFLVDNSVIYKKLELDKVKAEKEKTSHLVIYKDTGYLMKIEIKEELLEIEVAEELEEQLGQWLMRNKKEIEQELNLVRLVTVCPTVCLLGEFLQEEKRLSDGDRMEQLELAANMFTKANLVESSTCLVLQLQDK